MIVIKGTCEKCGSSEDMVKRPAAYQKVESRGVFAYPLCANCYCEIVQPRHKELKVKLMDSEFQIVKLLKSIRVDLSSMIASKSLDQFKVVESEITELAQLNNLLEEDFRYKSSLAFEAARKLSIVQQELSRTKELLIKKFKGTYQSIRQAANSFSRDPEVRRQVFEKAGFKCLACGDPDFLSVDHIVPVKKGGSNDMSNLQCLCLSCNSSKGTKTDEEIKSVAMADSARDKAKRVAFNDKKRAYREKVALISGATQ